MTIKGGGVRRLMEKTILNFHFDYLNTSLIRNDSALTIILPFLEVQVENTNIIESNGTANMKDLTRNDSALTILSGMRAAKWGYIEIQ